MQAALSEKQLYCGSTGTEQMNFAVFINIETWLLKRNLRGRQIGCLFCIISEYGTVTIVGLEDEHRRSEFH